MFGEGMILMTKIDHLPNPAEVHGDLEIERLDIDRWENDGGRSISIVDNHHQI